MSGLTQEIMKSLSSYATAPAIERHCLFAIALRTAPQDLEKYRAAFIEIDRDRDGILCRSDVARAMSRVRRWCNYFVDPDSFLSAADLNGSGVLTFLEFVAACLHASLAPLDEWLAEQAFESLDRDNDGFLRSSQVLEVLGYVPPGLPRAFNIEEWKNCVLRCREATCKGASPAPQKAINSVPQTASFFEVLFGSGCAAPTVNDHDEIRSTGNASYKPSFFESHETSASFHGFDKPGMYMAQAEYGRAHRHAEGRRPPCQDAYFGSDPRDGLNLSSPAYVPRTNTPRM